MNPSPTPGSNPLNQGGNTKRFRGSKAKLTELVPTAKDDVLRISEADANQLIEKIEGGTKFTDKEIRILRPESLRIYMLYEHHEETRIFKTEFDKEKSPDFTKDVIIEKYGSADKALEKLVSGLSNFAFKLYAKEFATGGNLPEEIDYFARAYMQRIMPVRDIENARDAALSSLEEVRKKLKVDTKEKIAESLDDLVQSFRFLNDHKRNVIEAVNRIIQLGEILTEQKGTDAEQTMQKLSAITHTMHTASKKIQDYDRLKDSISASLKNICETYKIAPGADILSTIQAIGEYINNRKLALEFTAGALAGVTEEKQAQAAQISEQKDCILKQEADIVEKKKTIEKTEKERDKWYKFSLLKTNQVERFSRWWRKSVDLYAIKIMNFRHVEATKGRLEAAESENEVLQKTVSAQVGFVKEARTREAQLEATIDKFKSQKEHVGRGVYHFGLAKGLFYIAAGIVAYVAGQLHVANELNRVEDKTRSRNGQVAYIEKPYYVEGPERKIEVRVEVPGPERVVEKTIEKIVEGPERIVEKRVEVPIEKIVEKIVYKDAPLADVPAEVKGFRDGRAYVKFGDTFYFGKMEEISGIYKEIRQDESKLEKKFTPAERMKYFDKHAEKIIKK